jgi:hypothetical protein
MESIDPVTRHPKALHPYIDEVKDFLTVSGLPFVNVLTRLKEMS